MSFLESIQHGLEKASQEAARITKIQHLHNIVNDLTFKTSQQGQALVMQAMDMYHSGHLGQGELVAICQQIATYQQQIGEVQEELQRLQKPEDNTGEQAAPLASPPAGYPAYPQTAPPQAYAAGNAPTSYLAPSAAYPMPASVPAQPVAPAAPGGEPPRKHAAAHAGSAPVSTATPAGFEPTSTSAPGSYEQGVLPPVYSPFASHPAPATASAAAEPEKPATAHHSAKKADVEAPAKGQKA